MSQPLRSSSLMLVAAAASVAQQANVLKITDSRPVLRASKEIEQRYGVSIHYEDLRYDYLQDVEDITDRVLTPQQRALANPERRILVPRAKTISIVLAQRSTPVSEPDVATALEAVNAAVAASSDADTTFQVTESSGSIFIAGLRSRDRDGKGRTQVPVLSTRVTLSSGNSSALESLTSIIKEVSSRSRFRIELGNIPIRLLAASQVNVAVSNEPANLVIDRIFKALPISPAVSSANGRSTTSYQLLIDPRSRVYALNIGAASQEAGSVESASPSKAPQSQPDRFFRKNAPR